MLIKATKSYKKGIIMNAYFKLHLYVNTRGYFSACRKDPRICIGNILTFLKIP